MTEQDEQDDRIAKLINIIEGWAKEHPGLYEEEGEATLSALRNFIIANRIGFKEE